MIEVPTGDYVLHADHLLALQQARAEVWREAADLYDQHGTYDDEDNRSFRQKCEARAAGEK